MHTAATRLGGFEGSTLPQEQGELAAKIHRLLRWTFHFTRGNASSHPPSRTRMPHPPLTDRIRRGFATGCFTCTTQTTFGVRIPRERATRIAGTYARRMIQFRLFCLVHEETKLGYIAAMPVGLVIDV